jgi:hypothetical protein
MIRKSRRADFAGQLMSGCVTVEFIKFDWAVNWAFVLADAMLDEWEKQDRKKEIAG